MTTPRRPDEDDHDPELLAIDELADLERSHRQTGARVRSRSTTLIAGAACVLVLLFAVCLLVLWRG